MVMANAVLMPIRRSFFRFLCASFLFGFHPEGDSRVKTSHPTTSIHFLLGFRFSTTQVNDHQKSPKELRNTPKIGRYPKAWAFSEGWTDSSAQTALVKVDGQSDNPSSHHLSNVQNPYDIPFYWLVNRDPYNGLL